MYKLIDLQGTGAMRRLVFKNKKEVKEHLRSYHEPDIEDIEKCTLDDLLEIGSWELEKVKTTRICDVCGIEVIFNKHIYDITGMCGTCSTGEARLNYEED